MPLRLTPLRKILIPLTMLVMFLLPIALRYDPPSSAEAQPTRQIPLPDYDAMKISLPVLSTPAASPTPVAQITTQLLVDISHSNQFALSELESLTRLTALKGAHLTVTELYGDLEAALKTTDAFLVIAPTVPFTNEEVRLVQRFVGRGGRLLVIADPTRGGGDEWISLEDSASLGDSEIANLLLEPFGITFSNDYVYNMIKNEGNFRNVFFEDIAQHALTGGLKQVVFYGSHSLKAPTPLIVGNNNTLSSITDQGKNLAVAGSAADGKVLALGDLNFLLPPYSRVADNARLIENIATFLAHEPRQRALADFPYLFTRPVTLMVEDGRPLNQEMLTTITGAQQSLAQWGLDLTLGSKPQKGHDLLAFGVFPPDETLQPLLAPFGLKFSETEEAQEITSETPAPLTAETESPLTEELDWDALLAEMGDDSPTVTVPGFGKIQTAGIGLILYNDTATRNTVVLLADSQENLKILSRAFYSGSLESCAVQGKIAVCLLSEDEDDFYWEDSFSAEDYYTPETDFEPVG